MPVLEKSVDQAVVRWAKATFPGMVIIKLTTFAARGTAGWPDRVFFYRGRTLFIEMKSSKGKLTPIQEHSHKLLQAQGFTVFTINSADMGKSYLWGFFA